MSFLEDDASNDTALLAVVQLGPPVLSFPQFCGVLIMAMPEEPHLTSSHVRIRLPLDLTSAPEGFGWRSR